MTDPVTVRFTRWRVRNRRIVEEERPMLQQEVDHKRGSNGVCLHGCPGCAQEVRQLWGQVFIPIGEGKHLVRLTEGKVMLLTGDLVAPTTTFLLTRQEQETLVATLGALDSDPAVQLRGVQDETRLKP